MRLFDGLIDKLFGRRGARETNRTIQRGEIETEAIYGPLGKLSLALTTAADATQREVLPVLGVKQGATPSEPQILTQYEFFYFFLHLTIRFAVGSGFGSSQTRKLQAFLGPLIASTAVDSFFRHWPQDRKRGIKSDFFTKLNDAEIEYAKCRLPPGEDPLDNDTLFGRLSNNVARLWEREDDFAIRSAVFTASTRAYLDMQLEENLASVASVIDQVSLQELKAYWSSGA
jgi:hypothetical protein